jgi:hypothetical protein
MVYILTFLLGKKKKDNLYTLDWLKKTAWAQ